jgi:hypothetical protein
VSSGFWIGTLNGFVASSFLAFFSRFVAFLRVLLFFLLVMSFLLFLSFLSRDAPQKLLRSALPANGFVVSSFFTLRSALPFWLFFSSSSWLPFHLAPYLLPPAPPVGCKWRANLLRRQSSRQIMSFDKDPEERGMPTQQRPFHGVESVNIC